MHIAVLVPEDSVMSQLAFFAKRKFEAEGHQVFLVSHPPEELFETFLSRLKKVGLWASVDEIAYCLYENLFTPWSKELQGLDGEMPSEFSARIADIQSKVLGSCLEELCVDTLVAIGCRPINISFIPNTIVALNIHPGVLPRYRGVGSPEAVLYSDEQFVGFSIHRLTRRLDEGEIFLRKRSEFSSEFNVPRIYIKNYKLAIRTLAKHLHTSHCSSWPIEDDFAGEVMTEGRPLWRMPLSKVLARKIFSGAPYKSS